MPSRARRSRAPSRTSARSSTRPCARRRSASRWRTPTTSCASACSRPRRFWARTRRPRPPCPLARCYNCMTEPTCSSPAAATATSGAVEVKLGQTLSGQHGGDQERPYPRSAGGGQRTGPAEYGGPGMIKRLVDYALNNRFIVLVFAVLLFVWGAISFHNLPVEAYPDVANNYVNIITPVAGPLRRRGGAAGHGAARKRHGRHPAHDAPCVPPRWPVCPA